MTLPSALTAAPTVVALQYTGAPEHRTVATAALHAVLGSARLTARADGCWVFNGTDADLVPVWSQLKGWARYRSEDEAQTMCDTLAGATLFAGVVASVVLVCFLDFAFWLDVREHPGRAGIPLFGGLLGSALFVMAMVPLTMGMVSLISPRRPRWGAAARVAIDPFTRLVSRMRSRAK